MFFRSSKLKIFFLKLKTQNIFFGNSYKSWHHEYSITLDVELNLWFHEIVLLEKGFINQITLEKFESFLPLPAS